LYKAEWTIQHCATLSGLKWIDSDPLTQGALRDPGLWSTTPSGLVIAEKRDFKTRQRGNASLTVGLPNYAVAYS
jgi:hypothetical protein